MESLVTRQQLHSFYKGKKVLITGHTGFKGTWLIAMLHRLGATVKGYALEPQDSKKFVDLFTDLHLADTVIADIRDQQRFINEVVSFQPDLIFHLAAQSLVLRSYEIPAETFDVNVTGTAVVFEALRKLDKKCTTIIVTTDKVYENKELPVSYKEDDPLGGYDPYSASKACAEIVVSSFRNSFFHTDKINTHQKAIASARAGNVIGGGDWSENRIIPDTVRSLLKDQPVTVRNPGAVRPWQHVLEPLTGYLLLGACLDKYPAAFSKPFNFGPYPEDHLTVKELVEIAIRSWGKGVMETGNEAQPHEANLLKLNIQRALDEIKWQPLLNAREAIQWTIDWYKTDPSKQAEFTFAQIDNYLAK
ncbi:MAG: CDP-glucose 4,6-dehydratase [Chitinophagaceae bacterium]